MSRADHSDRIRDLFDEVVGLGPEERDARLSEVCGDDEALRREVESLLEAEDARGSGVRRALEGLQPSEEADGKGSAPSAPGEIPAALQAALADRYRIVRELGRGGMATVYLADDLRHERKVALKVLKPDLAAVVGAERFLAEIKTTAKLSHPHILPLHDSGEVDGLLYYVMPYVEGESLRDRLTREHQLPVEDAVRIATHVAEALDYAHRQGIIHRDIKPANILLLDGAPVVSDFGIALAVSAGGGDRLTETGLSVGTPHYMSPEQATGDKHVGPATDIYALGCVLYEMLIGEPPFTGSTPQAILGKIIAGEAESVSALRKTVPAHVDACVSRALQKLPADRFATAGELAHALADPSYGKPIPRGATPRETARSRAVIAALAALSVVLGIALVVDTIRYGAVPEGPPDPVAVALPPGHSLPHWMHHAAVLSPDGRAIAYVPVGPGSPSMIHYRGPGQLDGHPVNGTEGARDPFFSPDGAWIGFFAQNSIKRVRADGGRVETVTVVGSNANQGATWADTDTIYFVRAGDPRGVEKVAASGGAPEPVTAHDVTRAFPSALPGGRHLLYRKSRSNTDSIMVLDLDTGEERFIGEGRGEPLYSRSGHLLYRDGDDALVAAPFDLDRMEIVGLSVRVQPSAVRSYSMAADGTLLYVEEAPPPPSSIVAVSRAGEARVLEAVQCVGCWDPAYSPDGRRLAVTQDGDIRVYDLEGGGHIPVTSDPESIDEEPEWRPPGDEISFTRRGDGVTGRILVAPVDRSRPPQRIVTTDEFHHSAHWAPDGRRFVFGHQRTLLTQVRVAVGDLHEGGVPEELTSGSIDQGPRMSPDGRWLAFTSRRTGRNEVWVRRFPDGADIQVSEDGGRWPVWGPAMDELFYRAAGGLWVATIRTEPDFRIVSTELLFGGQYSFGGAYSAAYDVHPSGEEFAVATPAPWDARMVRVRRFGEDLKRLAPR